MCQQSLEACAPLVLRLGAQISPVDGNEIECHERRRRLRRQLRHARRRGMKPHLQRVEIEAVGCRDHDLAVDDAAVRQGGEKASCKSGK